MEKLDPKFVETIDSLAHEYGWTIEYIQQLELDEINQLVEAIAKRKKFEWKMECYILNCAFAAKVPKLDDDVDPTDDSTLPEDVQLVKLSKFLDIDIKKV